MYLPGLNLLSFTFPLRMDYFSPLTAGLLFIGLGAVIVLIGLRSMAGLGPVRQWVAIGVRLLVLLAFILVLGNVKWVQPNKNVEVLVVRDISRSTGLSRDFPGKDLQSALDDWLRAVGTTSKEANPGKKPEDRIGQIVFNESPYIDVLPDREVSLETRAVRDAGTGTDAAAAIQMALATMDRDAMHRLVLVWDGNPTQGNVEEAATAAAAQHVPIDVFPVRYNVANEVMVDKLVSPSWRAEKQPFTLEVVIRSTNPVPVTAKLTVRHETEEGWVPMPIDGAKTTRAITLKPGLNVERIAVPAQPPGVHQFKAEVSDVSGVSVDGQTAGGQTVPGDTLAENNTGDIFTFVRGKGSVLFVDNVPGGGGDFLAKAMAEEGITARRIVPDQFPNDPVELQNYDAVILANVPRGGDKGGLQDHPQIDNLVKYVHDMGGGLVMIGGENTFGAGGWMGSDLEKELPVDMEIPAQRQMPKGALVLIMHACEFPQGNYWGEQCALKAIETLSARDEVGVITYGWNGPNGGGAHWDFPLGEKGDGSAVNTAVKNMQMGDMMSFDDAMNVALNGQNGQGGLLLSNARDKHVIIISDGDPQPPQRPLVDQYHNGKITVSTVTVFPHDTSQLPPTMKKLAQELKGKSYGPINDNFNQLPQIFIKEATIVRRSIIFENSKGIPLKFQPGASELVKGLTAADLHPLLGMDLTTPKNNPLVELPIVRAGNIPDPVLAHWQAGLGKAAVFTGDAFNRWDANWVGSPVYNKFWHQVIAGVSRPPTSTAYDVQMTTDGDKGHIVVEATDKDNSFNNFVDFQGTVAGGPGLKSKPIHLVQTGPGVYEGDFDAREAGNYICYLNYVGQSGSHGEPPPTGRLLAGTVVNTSPEMRELQSNEATLRRVAEMTGGRVLEPWKPQAANLFDRAGLAQTSSPQPILNYLIPALLALMILDVAVRRIAWDWEAVKKLANAGAAHVQNFTVATLARKPEEKGQSLDALKRVRGEAAEGKLKAGDQPTIQPQPAPRPDPGAKFTAKSGVEGDISKIVGGATDKPIPSAPKKIEPKGAPAGGTMGGLLEAKRRAQQKIREKEKGEE